MLSLVRKFRRFDFTLGFTCKKWRARTIAGVKSEHAPQTRFNTTERTD